LSRALSAAGRNRDSLAAAARAVVADSDAGVRRNVVYGLTEAAWVLSGEGDSERGTRLFDAALSVARRFGNTRYESAVHARAARAHLAAGRFARAAEHAEHAEATRISAGTGAVHTHNLLIRYTALRRLGRNIDAAECYRTAATQIPDFDAALTAWTAETHLPATR
ncbi:hypothetical protein, partial [Nocardia sp. NPDC004722]